MDYDDVVYDQLSNDDFSNKIETVPYNAALAIMGAIKGHLAKNYQELALEYLQQKRWMRFLCLVYKVVTTKIPAFIYDFIPPLIQSLRDIKTHLIPSLAELTFLKTHFFPCVTAE